MTVKTRVKKLEGRFKNAPVLVVEQDIDNPDQYHQQDLEGNITRTYTREDIIALSVDHHIVVFNWTSVKNDKPLPGFKDITWED